MLERKGGRPTFAAKCQVVGSDTYHQNLAGEGLKLQFNVLVEACEHEVGARARAYVFACVAVISCIGVAVGCRVVVCVGCLALAGA